MERGYHHGALRQAILDAAVEVIAVDGPGALSLRELARRANVSHAAPAHHFKDKAGLLTAIATDGYARLADALLASPGGSLLEVGASYVRFALAHPAHFEVMFRPDLYYPDDADLDAARRRSSEALRAAVGSDGKGRNDRLTELAAWSLAHGFATLWASGVMTRAAGGRDPVALFRACATLTFPTRR
jgi:AcrR family transcriptional regulator